MALYTRHQLLVLLTLLGATAVGLAVREWRATHPELADHLERFDRAPESARPGAAPALSQVQPAGRVDHAGRLPHASGVDRAGAPTREPTPEREGAALDLNRATADELTRLPGMGPVLAARIVAARASEGRFTSVEALSRVHGIGPAKLARLRAHLTVSD